MKYKVPHWAVAALSLATLLWLGSWRTTPALAVEQVIQNLANAKTARFRLTVQVTGQPEAKSQAFFMQPNRLRQVMDSGSVFIVDWDVGRMVTLVPAAKQATVINLLNQPPEMKRASQNPFESTRDRLKQAIADPRVKVESLGTKEIGGRKLVGFRIPMSQQTTTVWADPDTQFPVRIEVDGVGPPTTHVVMSDYELNVELDESQFALTIPEGYQVQESQLDVSPGTEAEFLATLRTCAETLDGEFPAGLNAAAVANYVGKYFGTVMARRANAPSAPSAQALNQITRGLMFVATFGDQLEGHYAGGTAKLNEKDKPILWYKPNGLATYRVIYADLTVRVETSAPTVPHAAPLNP